MKNPFYYGNEVADDDFCNRVLELSELKKDALSGQNVLIYAPRRFGKTSLLKKLKLQLEQTKEVKVIYVDLLSVSNIDEFIQKYFNQLVKTFETNRDKVLNLFKDVLQLRPAVSMKINGYGDISYNLSLNKKEQMETLEEVLNLPHIYAQKTSKKVVVIFDEFQEIEQLAFENKLRSVLQTHSRELSYMFSGSKKSILNQMFGDKHRAFYKSVKHFTIKEIDLQDWTSFIKEKFSVTAKNIEQIYIEKVYEITEGFPYYMQQIMSAVWDATQKEVDEKIITDSLALIVERETDLYAYIWAQLTPNQKKSLKYIIRNDGLNLYVNDSLREADISATTLKSTLESLLKKDVCDKKNDRYYLVDPFMKYWLENLE
jgi:AAA+ ATPase superfamily predicted ATPase